MSIDDQLFKEDGTLLTKIDIFVLKSARLIATYVFSDPEDETYEKALAGMRKLAGVLFILSALMRGYLQDYLPLIVLGPYGALKILHSYAGSNGDCNGRGTRIASREKLVYLTVLMIASSVGLGILPLEITLGHLVKALPLLPESIGFVVACLADGYVSRLGARPPRKKRERVPVPVLSP